MTQPATSVWSALALSQVVIGGVVWIDPNSFQPNVDALNFYWDLVNKRLSIATVGDFSGTDPINSGGQVDSYVPQGFVIGTVGSPPGMSVSSSRGSRLAPTILLTGDPIGSFGGYPYLGDGIVIAKNYFEGASVRYYVAGVHATYPGVEMRWGTKADNGPYTEWVKLDILGNLYPLLAGTSKLGSNAKGWGAFFLDYTNAGVAGAQVINKPSGSVLFAAAAQTLVVTNALVTAASVIILTVSGDDATAKSAVISVQGAGTFTIKLNAAATAQLKVNFLVVGAD